MWNRTWKNGRGGGKMGDVLIKKKQGKQCRKVFVQSHALEKYCSAECRELHKKLTDYKYKRGRHEKSCEGR